MALVVEDGSNVAGAETFISRADAIAYAKSRGVTLADDETTDAKIIRAMDFLISQCFKGETAFLNQILPFPRKGIVDGDCVPGFEYSIPANIVRAQSQLVLDIANGVDVMPTIEATAGARKLKRSKTGPIEREYFDTSSGAGASTVPVMPIVAAALAPLLCGQGVAFRTYRA